VFCHFQLTSFGTRILVFKSGSRNPSKCILLFWNTVNTSFDMPLVREECVMLVLLLEVFRGLAHDVEALKIFSKFKKWKAKETLSYDIPFMATPSFGYDVPFQLLWYCGTICLRISNLWNKKCPYIRYCGLWFRWNWCFSNVKFWKSSLCNKLGPYLHMVVKWFWQQSSW